MTSEFRPTQLFIGQRRLAPLFAPLLEQRCAACAAPVAQAERRPLMPHLCAECAAELVRKTAGHCTRCGDIMKSPNAPAAPCGDCLLKSRPWNAFFFYGAYEGLLRNILLRLKQNQELPLADLLGRLLAAHPGIIGPYDAVVPLPLHEKRLRERGFNQTAELVPPLAKRLKTPVFRTALARTKSTRPQAGLSLQQRKDNVGGIFTARSEVAGKRLLLVDDIATTCATLEAATRALTAAGAALVDVAVVARTPRAR